MKTKNLILSAAAALLAFAGCQKPVDLGPEQVSIDSEATVEVPVEGDEFTVNLKATVDWALQGYDEVKSWVSVLPESGKASAETQTVTIKVLPNDGKARTASLVFYGNIMCKAPLTINQDGQKVDEGDGSKESPYNIDAAIKMIDDGGFASTPDNKNESEEKYVKGIISSIKNVDTGSYGNAEYVISDDGTTTSTQLTVYRGYYLGGEKFTSEGQIKVGDEVIVYGRLTKFFETYEFVAGNKIYSLNGETAGGEDPDPEQPVDKPTSGTKVSVKDFLAKEANTTDWYDLTGTIESIEKADFGNFYMSDETGRVYVYGLVKEWADGKNDQSFSQIGLKVGDKVTIRTLRAEYNGSAQAGGTIPALYLSHEAGEAVTYPEGSVILSFPDENKENNKVNGYKDEPWVARIGSNEWNITQFNNYEWQNWTYIRCGRKNVEAVGVIATKTALSKTSKVVVTADKLDPSLVNGVTLTVYSDADLKTQVGEAIAPKNGAAAGDMTFEIPAASQKAGQYYKLSFDCKAAPSDGKNGFVQISKVVYVAAE